MFVIGRIGAYVKDLHLLLTRRYDMKRIVEIVLVAAEHKPIGLQVVLRPRQLHDAALSGRDVNCGFASRRFGKCANPARRPRCNKELIILRIGGADNANPRLGIRRCFFTRQKLHKGVRRALGRKAPVDHANPLRPLESLQRVELRTFLKIADDDDLRLGGRLFHIAGGGNFARHGCQRRAEIRGLPRGPQLFRRLTHDLYSARCRVSLARIKADFGAQRVLLVLRSSSDCKTGGSRSKGQRSASDGVVVRLPLVRGSESLVDRRFVLGNRH